MDPVRQPVCLSIRKRICRNTGWRLGVAVASFVARERSCSTLSPVSTGMGDRLQAGIPEQLQD